MTIRSLLYIFLISQLITIWYSFLVTVHTNIPLFTHMALCILARNAISGILIILYIPFALVVWGNDSTFLHTSTNALFIVFHTNIPLFTHVALSLLARNVISGILIILYIPFALVAWGNYSTSLHVSADALFIAFSTPEIMDVKPILYSISGHTNDAMIHVITIWWNHALL